MITININDVDLTQHDIFDSVFKSGLDIVGKTLTEDVHINYYSKLIAECYMDFNEERQDYSPFIWIKDNRFTWYIIKNNY